MKIYIAIGAIILAAGIYFYGEHNGAIKERVKVQNAVLAQKDKDAKTVRKLRKENALLAKTTKTFAKSLRESEDSSNCSRTPYPPDRLKRLHNALRSIESH